MASYRILPFLIPNSSSVGCAQFRWPVMAQPGGSCMLSKRVVLVVVALCCVFALVPTALFSQETTAGVQGYVKDPTGAVVAGATVEVSGPTLLGSRKTETDTTGFYRFSSLPAGSYTITVTPKGFRVGKREGVSLHVGRLPNVDIQLEIGTASEVLEGRAEA